jgi:hypothetical protein
MRNVQDGTGTIGSVFLQWTDQLPELAFITRQLYSPKARTEAAIVPQRSE